MTDGQRQRETPGREASVPELHDGHAALEFPYAAGRRCRGRDNLQGGDDLGSDDRRQSNLWVKKLPGSLHDLAPWLDQRLFPLELVLTRLEQQTHRRSIKTHLPLDGLPFHQSIKYVYVGRDPRDVFMSFWNFYGNFSPQMIAAINGIPGRVGDELQKCPDDVHELWHNWITRGWFEWESEGYPFWSVMHHAQTWWDYRHRQNILFVHYADLLADMEGGIRRIARYLEIEPPADAWPTIVRNCSFAEMKAHGDELMPMMKMLLKGGPIPSSTRAPMGGGARC
jgi:aryl sulfotransferase